MEERFSYQIKESDRELPIRNLLKYRMGFSSRLLRKLKLGECVWLNGQPVKLYERGKAGDVIAVELPEEQSGFLSEPIPIEVLYEDGDLLVLNKQPGIVCHPTKGHVCHTIANAVQYYMEEREQVYKIRFINRLDMDTSGVLLLGKNSHAQDHFSKQAAAGRVVKKYLAVVNGWVEAEEGAIDLPIALEAEGQLRRAVREDGYPSVTHYKVLERFSRTTDISSDSVEPDRCIIEDDYAGIPQLQQERKMSYTLLELVLETGRTHQIRVHLAYIGHPVVGDVLYGSPDVWRIERQALHACSLAFDHPATGAPMKIEAPLPKDMRLLLEKLR